VAHRGRDRAISLPVPRPLTEEAEAISAWQQNSTDPNAEH
jgi:hypothetical protein